MVSIPPLHNWDLTAQEAVLLQKELAQRIITTTIVSNVQVIAGIDMALVPKTNMGHAALVLYTYPDLTLIEQHTHSAPLRMPYIPGLLSFRELPVMLQVFEKIRQLPDLILVDGMGIAHPRHIGIASHLGLWLNIPTIGCGKSRLIGSYDKNKLGNTAGSHVPLLYKKEVIGAVVRTRTGVHPLFISPGHLITIEASVDYVLACTRGYRLPEPVRQADKLSKLRVS